MAGKISDPTPTGNFQNFNPTPGISTDDLFLLVVLVVGDYCPLTNGTSARHVYFATDGCAGRRWLDRALSV